MRRQRPSAAPSRGGSARPCGRGSGSASVGAAAAVAGRGAARAVWSPASGTPHVGAEDDVEDDRQRPTSTVVFAGSRASPVRERGERLPAHRRKGTDVSLSSDDVANVDKVLGRDCLVDRAATTKPVCACQVVLISGDRGGQGGDVARQEAADVRAVERPPRPAACFIDLADEGRSRWRRLRRALLKPLSGRGSPRIKAANEAAAADADGFRIKASTASWRARRKPSSPISSRGGPSSSGQGGSGGS